jgi:hyperosmotically inducible periplasmic protein
MTRIIAGLGLLLAAACDQPSDQGTVDKNATEMKADDKSTTTTGSTAGTPPDNTDVNDRDRDGATLTPEDQGNNPMDLGVTQRVRQAIVATDGLTMGEKNVKVITVNGVVTLRGPVESEESKTKIAALAKDAVGVTSVDNQLEVTGTASASADKNDDDDDDDNTTK